MTTMLALSSRKSLTPEVLVRGVIGRGPHGQVLVRGVTRFCGWLATCAIAATALVAQAPAPRIQAQVSSSEMSVLKGSLNPLAQPQFDAGRLPADTRLTGMSIVFSPSAAQQADLDALIAAQQDPASPLFHKWLTPDQFAARFGMAQSDLDQVQTWLQQQGFTVDSVARSRNMIRFSGSAGQVEQAFQTQMHYFNVEGAKHIAPSTDLSLPAALAPVVQAVRNLDDFRPRPMHIRSNAANANPAFTSGQSGSVFFTPGDIKVAYDMNPLLNAAFNGSGQTIAIMGQSSIQVSDIENFQKAVGLPVVDPTQVLVPGSGNPQAFTGDAGESDIDIEWAGAMAPGADIFFVFTGDSTTSNGVFDSIVYAVDQKIGDIISVSYGTCESLLGTFSLETTFQQAASQGQTIVAASGDAGSTSCWTGSTASGQPSIAQQQALAVNYPASSPYVTGIGGTEISQTSPAYFTAGSAYWSGNPSPPAGTADIVTSVLQYIPEVAWNDSALSAQAGGGLSATGGGPSALFAKPSWQKGVPGIPADSKRDVPDVALYSSPEFVAYLFCTSDQSDWNTGQQASCNSGFRDSASGLLTAAGGTSFATPVFAAMIAIINQKNGYAAGSGLINPTLYTLASNSATYASGFHDVTSGNNECPPSLTTIVAPCTGPATTNYSATAGYDLTTGLGSVDLNNLVTATGWPAPILLIGTTTSVAASSAAPSLNANVTFTITVTAASGAAPTGNVTISVDGAGTSFGAGSTTTVALTAGTGTYTTSFATSGVHQVLAQYPGDSTHAASTGVASVSVPAPTNPGTFAMAATATSISQGATGTSTITVTPANGYKGTVNITPSSTNATFCYNTTQAAVTGTAAVTTTMTIDTNLLDCGGAAVRSHGMHLYTPGARKAQVTPRTGPSIAKSAIGIAGIFFAGLIGWRFRRSRLVASMIALGIVGFALSACGGGGSSNSNKTPKGTYTITLTGQDATTSTITASTTFTLTVH